MTQGERRKKGMFSGFLAPYGRLAMKTSNYTVQGDE